MKQIKLAHLFLSIIFLTASTTVFCSERPQRPSSSPPLREYDDSIRKLKKIKSNLEKKFEKSEKKFNKQKELMTKSRVRKKLSILSIKIPDRGCPAIKLINNLGENYSPQKTPEDIIKENTPYISEMVGKKHIERYPKRPRVGIFEGANNETSKNLHGRKLAKLIAFRPKIAAEYYNECLNRKDEAFVD